MTLAYDNATSSAFASGASKTVTHTMGTAPYGALFAFLMWTGAAAPTGDTATWNGVAMTALSLTSEGTNRGCRGWLKTAVSTGSHDCAISWTGDVTGVVAVVSFTGVDQITPYANIVKANGNNTTVTVNVAGTVAGQLVLDAVTLAWATGDTVTCSQTQRTKTYTADPGGMASTKAGGGTVTMAWTPSATHLWRQLAMSVMPAVIPASQIRIF